MAPLCSFVQPMSPRIQAKFKRAVRSVVGKRTVETGNPSYCTKDGQVYFEVVGDIGGVDQAIASWRDKIRGHIPRHASKIIWRIAPELSRAGRRYKVYSRLFVL